MVFQCYGFSQICTDERESCVCDMNFFTEDPSKPNPYCGRYSMPSMPTLPENPIVVPLAFQEKQKTKGPISKSANEAWNKDWPCLKPLKSTCTVCPTWKWAK